MKEENRFTIETKTLIDAFKKTSHSVSKIETRPILTGVRLYQDVGGLSMVSTDAHRLSLVSGLSSVETLNEGIVIPGKTVKELPMLIEDAKEVDISHDGGLLTVYSDNCIITSRTLDGNYPDTNRLIPNVEDAKTKVRVNRQGLIDSLERVSILADKKIVKAVIGGESDSMFDAIVLSQSNQELGSSEEQVLVEEIEGEDLTISFDSDYMLDGLKALESEEVTIEFNTNSRPFVIREEIEGVNNLQLILPVRTF